MTAPARRRRRRSDSTAHTIAASMSLRDNPGGTISYLRVPFGAQVAHYNIPGNRAPLVAAAEVIHGGTGRKRRRAPSERWQDSVWELRDEVPEYRFSGDRVARAASQCWLYIAEVPESDDDTPTPVDSGPVYDLGRQMFGDRGASGQQLRLAVQHLQFNGESNLVFSQDEDTGDMAWTAHSVDELTGTPDNYRIDDGVEPRDLTPQEIVTRCWWPHPRKSGKADAPARAVLPVARELRALTEHTSALIDSRLAGAGLLLVPNDIEVLAGQASSPKEGDPEGDLDAFVHALLEAMTTPLQNRDSAAAVVPLVAKVSPDSVDKFKHLSFASTLDPMAKDMREEAIRRIGLGMDSDPQVLLGQGGANHWSAWLVTEDEVKLVISPTVATVCHAFTTGWLRPVLELVDGVNPRDYLVWFSTDNLALRPDKSQDARALYDAGLLSDEATLRENGFNPDEDMASDDERNRRLLIQLMLADPSFAQAVLDYLGIAIELPDPPAPVVAPPPPEEPDTEDDGSSPNDIPDTDTQPEPETPDTPGASE